MRALLVVQEPVARDLLKDHLVRQGCEPLAGCELHEEWPRESIGAPLPLAFIQPTEPAAAEGLCREARARAGGPGWIIGVCAADDRALLESLLNAGVDDLLSLPLDTEQVGLRIAMAIRQAESRSALPHGGLPASDLRDMERRFHVQGAFFEALFESSPEAVVLIDADGRVVRINSEFSRMFGYSAAESERQRLNELIVPEEQLAEAVEVDGGVLRGGRVALETVRRHRDGGVIHVSVLATHIDVDGPAGAIGIYRDITEKKRREAALKESEERYRALFDQSPVGVFLCDGKLRITHCNTALTRLVGAPYEEIVGAHLVSLRDRRLIPGLRAALGGKPAWYEGPYRSRVGDQHHVSIRYAPLRDSGGRVMGGMGVMEDITDRVGAEKQLRAQATEMERVNSALRERTLELEAAMQARSRLYTAMNHELRTPISAVMLYQELLIAGSLGPLEEEQRRALEHSHTATRHLLELVRDILDLSKIEAGKVTVQPTRVCLRKLIDEIVAAVAPLSERYGSTLIVKVEEGLGDLVTDPQRVRQILLNFLSNASKYGREKPIEVTCRRIGVSEVAIEVKDRGIGIAPQDLTAIFEDFVQLGAKNEEGTGLGLAISRRLADLLGARVEVESEVGAGSTFRLILPAPESDRSLSVDADGS